MSDKLSRKSPEKLTNFSVRELRPGDAEPIRRMHAQSWLDTYPNEAAGVPREWVQQQTDSWLTDEGLEKSRERFTAIIGDPEQFYRVAEDDGRIIGMVHGEVKQEHKHLAALYVDADYHGKGVAQELMKRADEWFGDDEVDLEVITYNERAIRFYEKHGFVMTNQENELFKGKMPNITMVRKKRKV